MNRVEDVLKRSGRSTIRLFSGDSYELPLISTTGEAISGTGNSHLLSERSNRLLSDVLPVNYWGMDYDQIVDAIPTEIDRFCQKNGIPRLNIRQKDELTRKLQRYFASHRESNLRKNAPNGVVSVQVETTDDNRDFFYQSQSLRETALNAGTFKDGATRLYVATNSRSLPELRLGIDIDILAAGLGLNRRQLPLERIQAVGLGKDVSSYFIGREVTGNGNQLLENYFTNNAFEGTTREAVIEDWFKAVAYCKENGLDQEAFIKDGDLFKVTPNAHLYLKDNLTAFPGLDPRKVNDGTYVDHWLKTVEIGTAEGRVKPADWLILLTGYTPEDNVAVPQLTRRYEQVLNSLN